MAGEREGAKEDEEMGEKEEENLKLAHHCGFNRILLY